MCKGGDIQLQYNNRADRLLCLNYVASGWLLSVAVAQKQRGGDEAMDGAVSSGAGEGGGDYDDEPVLKYQRMGADVGSLLAADAGEKETVVRMAVHDTCLVG